MKFTAEQIITGIIAFLYFAMVTLLAIFADGNTAAGCGMLGLLAVLFLGIFVSMAGD